MRLKRTGQWMIAAGLVLNIVDGITSITRDASGTTVVDPMRGLLFGSSGVLAPIDRALPHPNVPVLNVPLNLGGWLIIVGLILWAFAAVRARG